MKINYFVILIVTTILTTLMIFSCQPSPVPEKKSMVRLARLIIDSVQLESYKAFLKEEIESSLRLEPGVKNLYAVAEKNNPTYITILEIYADTAAYQSHIQTPHFLKYKTGTKEMVKSLELVETVPLIPEMQLRQK
jgi:quinol monooxygenase YgiN